MAKMVGYQKHRHNKLITLMDTHFVNTNSRIPWRFEWGSFRRILTKSSILDVIWTECPRMWRAAIRSLHWNGNGIGQNITMGILTTEIEFFGAAAPKGTKSCRTQGEPICPSVRPSPPAPSSGLLLLWGLFWPQFCQITQIHAILPKSNQNDPNPSILAQIWSESRYWRPKRWTSDQK